MSNSISEVILPFGDGEYKFELEWKSVTTWERQHDRSMMATFRHMVESRSASLEDTRTFLHMGLVGGGMTPVNATGLVSRFVERRPLGESFPIALAVLEAFLFGNEAYRQQKGDDVVTV